MLVLRLELWPHGSEHDKRELGRMTVVNDGTGSGDIGNYDVTMFNGERVAHLLRVTGWPRRRGAWALVREALRGGAVGGGWGAMKERKRRRRPDPYVCASCGRADWIDAIDNFGNKYVGCAHCRLKSAAELTVTICPPGSRP